MPRFVHVDRVDGVATVRLDRPPFNAFDADLRLELGDAVRGLADDESVRAVGLTGGPKVFAAGADLKQLSSMTYEEISGWNRALQRVFAEVASLPTPVVAAINGVALGGGMELALAADFRVMAEDAVVGLPEVKLGIVPGAGGMQRLTRLVGISRAKRIVMSGRRLNATDAHELGLVEDVVPPADVLATAQAMAAEFARGPRLALQAIKESVDLGVESSLAAGLALDRSALAGMFATDDRRVGIASFFEGGLGTARFGRTAE